MRTGGGEGGKEAYLSVYEVRRKRKSQEEKRTKLKIRQLQHFATEKIEPQLSRETRVVQNSKCKVPT